MKIPDAVIKVKDLDLVEFLDNVQVILNNGLYETRVVSTAPTWLANNGESALYYTNSDNRKLYFYVNTGWTYIGWNSIGSLTLFDADGDTGITPEATPNENVIRFYAATSYMFAISTFGLAMSAGTPIVFDGLTGISKWYYDSTTRYLTGYVDGAKRIEM